MNGGDDAVVGSAAADVSLQRFLDGGGGGRGIFAEECNGGQDHSGRAIAALQGVVIDKALLDRMELGTFCQAFDGGDVFAFGGSEFDLAGAGGNAIEENGAGSALPFPAAVFCAGQFEIVAEDKEEWPLAVGVDLLSGSVDRYVHKLSVMRLSEWGRDGVVKCVKRSLALPD